MNPDLPDEADGPPIDAPWPLGSLPAQGDEIFVFSLYIAGMNPRSRRAVDNLTKLCEQHLAGRYRIQVVDIYQQPELARAEQLVAAPTLVRTLPLPLRRFVGDLADTKRVLMRLNIRPKA